MRRHSAWQGLNRHLNYTVDDAAKVLKVSKGTVRRWVKTGQLEAIGEGRQLLILGHAIDAFVKARRAPKIKLALNECYCFHCRAARPAAGGMAELTAVNAKTGNLLALCDACTGPMRKRISLRRLPEFRTLFDLTVRQADPTLSE